jgi:hypothetical protein
MYEDFVFFLQERLEDLAAEVNREGGFRIRRRR